MSGQPQKTSRDPGAEPLRLGAPPRHPAVRASAPPTRSAESAIPLELLIPKAPTGRGNAPPATTKSVSDALLKIADEDSRVADAERVRDTAPDLARAVRRDESVIAEAVRLRRSRGARAVDASRALFERLAAAPKALVDAALAWPMKLQRLPPAERKVVIAAPFVMAAILALGLVALERRPSPAEAAIAPPAPTPAAATVIVGGRRPDAPSAAPIAAPTAAPTQASAETPPPAPAAEPALAAAVPAGAPAAGAPAAGAAPPGAPTLASAAPNTPGGTATAATLASVRRRVEQRAAIVVAAKRSAQRVLSLEVGAELTTYPAFPAGEGWVLARADGGETGYVRTSAFDPRPATDPLAAAPTRRAVRAEARALPAARSLDAPVAKKRALRAEATRATPTRAELSRRDAKRKKPPKSVGELTAEDLLLGR